MTWFRTNRETGSANPAILRADCPDHRDVGQLMQRLVHSGRLPETRVDWRMLPCHGVTCLGPVYVEMHDPFGDDQSDEKNRR